MELIQLIADWSCVEWHTTKNILPGVVVIRVRQKRPHSVANKGWHVSGVMAKKTAI